MAKNKHQLFVDSARPYYELWLRFQNGHCGLCPSTPSESRRLDIDHDHKNMHIRGLLCHRCNRILPDWVTPEWLRRAADWVEEGEHVRVGDFVELRKRLRDPRGHIPAGARGKVVRLDGDFATVAPLQDGSRFEAPTINLSRLVRAEAF